MHGHGGAEIVAVVGRSGSGKTTLLERLAAELSRRGVRLAAVKHASHGFLADRPGKDSYRLYEAGAASVAVVSGEQVATFTRLAPSEAPEISLATALATLPASLDLVLVEGFSWEPVPRIVVVPAGEQALPEHLAGGPVLCVVAAPAETAGQKPAFPDSLVAEIAGGLERAAAARQRVADHERPGRSPVHR